MYCTLEKIKVNNMLDMPDVCRYSGARCETCGFEIDEVARRKKIARDDGYQINNKGLRYLLIPKKETE